MLNVLVLMLACGTSEPAPEAATTEAPTTEAAEAAPAAEAPAAEGEQASAGDWSHHGDPFTDGAETIEIATLMDTPDDFVGKTVRMKGEIADVCQKKGCWMVIQDDKARTMRVTMKDHAFGVPMDSKGPCDVEGTVIKKEPNAKEAIHFASEAGNAEAIPEGEGVKPTYEIVVSAVSVKQG